ncbi:MAG: bifunctional folylpolyglutamate synthase/dihydrofolate synthase [Verrucomicrobiae bacterium]|nr:bifunctional folylpolyglutamate synthase/dihydrofolate synthase [Verrucomicrobiae bacterium]
MSASLLKELFARKQLGVKLGLETMHALAREIGNPEKDLNFIHIAGTNGKGSTAAMLAAILQKAGYKVGLFTSPHLISFGERIQINRVPLSEEKIMELYEALQPALFEVEANASLHTPTFFEITTALALLAFREAQVDWVIWETGLGGRLDSTNIVQPKFSILTAISFDHTQWLGTTLSQIATEKAGIIKKKVPVICAPQVEEVKQVIQQRAEEQEALCFFVNQKNIFLESETCEGQQFSYRSTSYSLSLLGSHQRQNAAVVLEMVCQLRESGVNISEEAVVNGLKTVTWPARFQFLQKDPLAILDGAHNEAGIEGLVQQYRSLFGEAKINLIFGVLADKNIDAMVNQLLPIIKKVALVAPMSSRALKPVIAASCFAVKDCDTAIFSNFQQAWLRFQGEPVLITGSLYLAGEVLGCLRF